MLEDIPNVLTPNNDGINDILITDAFLETTDLQISIFNRWGNLIYQTIDPLVNWDGKTNMGEVVDGVYFLTAEFKNCNDKRQKLAKSITVLR
jgi:gliding motility-associated-like protein